MKRTLAEAEKIAPAVQAWGWAMALFALAGRCPADDGSRDMEWRDLDLESEEPT